MAQQLYRCADCEPLIALEGLNPERFFDSSSKSFKFKEGDFYERLKQLVAQIIEYIKSCELCRQHGPSARFANVKTTSCTRSSLTASKSVPTVCPAFTKRVSRVLTSLYVVSIRRTANRPSLYRECGRELTRATHCVTVRADGFLHFS